MGLSFVLNTVGKSSCHLNLMSLCESLVPTAAIVRFSSIRKVGWNPTWKASTRARNNKCFLLYMLMVDGATDLVAVFGNQFHFPVSFK